jgi:hypothetical protein|tara:strand:+ start:253 stop:726 length:474 start_codon:yes stop_codon:yes gene_type:complete
MKYLLTFIFFFISSCGFAPLDNSKTEVTKVFMIYQDNLLNNQFINEIKRKRGFLNLQLTDSESAEIKIEIIEHKIDKYTGATDRNFFSATGNLDYEILMKISKKNKNKEFVFSSSESFPYDTNKILSNEKKMEALQNMFFLEVQNQLRIFLNLYFND